MNSGSSGTAGGFRVALPHSLASLTYSEPRFMLPPGGEMGPSSRNRARRRAEPKGKFLSLIWVTFYMIQQPFLR
jgi:hypothetical protein